MCLFVISVHKEGLHCRFGVQYHFAVTNCYFYLSIKLPRLAHAYTYVCVYVKQAKK